MRAALMVCLFCAAAAAPLHAHTRLERSSPAAGDTLHSPPAELRLLFSQPVETRYTVVALRGPGGATVPTPAFQGEQRLREFVTALPPLTVPGRYTVEWRTIAGDGHVISGEFTFVLDVPAAAADPTGPADGALDSVAPVPPPSDGSERTVVVPAWVRSDSGPSVLARALVFAGIIGVIGLAVFRAAMLPGLRARLPESARAAVFASLRRFGHAAALVLFVGLLLRAALQSAALHGLADSLEPRRLAGMLADLAWGRAWLVQVAATLLAWFAAGAAAATPLLALAATALAVTPAFQGHAAATEGAGALPLIADAVHVLAAGSWVGGLAVLVLAAIPALRRSPEPERARSILRLVQRFSPVALGAAATLALSGAGSALVHLGTPRDLYGTEYGRMLLVKLFFVALVLVVGAWNWRRALPRLQRDGSEAGLYRTATLELLLAGAALAATAVLVALPTP